MQFSSYLPAWKAVDSSLLSRLEVCSSRFAHSAEGSRNTSSVPLSAALGWLAGTGGLSVGYPAPGFGPEIIACI